VHRALTNFSLLALVVPLVAGCGGAPDFLSKDAEWFSRPARIFAPRSVSLDTGPLSPSGPVSPNELVSADGACAGAPADANASADQPGQGGGYALGNTECAVVRAAGTPDNVAINGGDAGREATLTYLRGPRPGIYHFNGGRLTSVEAAPAPPAPPRPARSAPKGAAKAKRAT
jgi:hypothetical protein